MGKTNSNIRQFSGDMSGKRWNIAANKIKNSTPYSVFVLYIAAVITLLVEETSQLPTILRFLDDGPSPIPDVTESEIFLFLTIQMEFDTCDILKDN
jgi:hypothetical protein